MESKEHAGRQLEKLDSVIESILRAAQIPGAAVAVVAGDEMIFAKGYGYRDVTTKAPVTANTLYPIASTTKALNATLLGILVDEGALVWDTPVQCYVPGFRLRDPALGTQVSLRDLITMRTGLPRHDFIWNRSALSRAELVSRLRYLELSAGFREKFQYNNLTVTAAGHVAEVVTGQSWETLLRQKILEPLDMTGTGFSAAIREDMTRSYHENALRELVPYRPIATDVIAPAGGSVHSHVLDMARWMSLNLSGGKIDGRSLIQPKTLAEIHAPQIPSHADPSSPSAAACYAMGWFVDTYRGTARLGHGGYIHDVNSEVSLHPEEGIGIVSFINLGCVGLARTINQYVFDVIKGFKLPTTVEEKLADYEKRTEDTRIRNASARRVTGTSPSHPLSDYEGVYQEPGYGVIQIRKLGDELQFQRGDLTLPLEHWHYDAWVAQPSDLFLIHVPHVFDKTSRFLFETSPDGDIAALLIKFEAAVSPIRFVKQL